MLAGCRRGEAIAALPSRHVRALLPAGLEGKEDHRTDYESGAFEIAGFDGSIKSKFEYR